jgi:secretion/DNA translocation related TadE-like protein
VDRDRGAATVVACVGAVVLLVVTGLAVRVGAAVLARQRAETGADLAALAGAAQMLRGAEVACAAAGVVARANDVVVSGCRADGQDLLVEVTAEVAGSLGGSAVGRARAGPVTSIEGAALPAPRAGDGVDAVPRGVRRVVPAR